MVHDGTLGEDNIVLMIVRQRLQVSPVLESGRPELRCDPPRKPSHELVLVLLPSLHMLP